MHGLTKTEVKSITTWDKSMIRVGDVVAYVQKPYAIGFRAYRYYGIVTNVDDEYLSITSSCEYPNEEPRITKYDLHAENASRIEYVLRNGVKPE